MRGNIESVRFLVKVAGVQFEKEDIFGNTPLSNARKLHMHDAIDTLVEAEGAAAREESLVVCTQPF